MARIQIPIAGISTTSTYEDGATASLVNLRPENGALTPVTPRKIEQELSQEYDIIFIHRNNDYENWIGVVNGTGEAYIYWGIKDAPKLIQSVPGDVNSVQQVGNTLSIITADSIYYLIYNDGDYVFLGELPQVPPIKFFNRDVMSYNRENVSDTTPENIVESIKAAVNLAMKNMTAFGAVYLFDAHFFRYAFRLHDGTLIKHSPPILVMPPKPITGGLTTDQPSGESIKTYTAADSSTGIPAQVTVYGYKVFVNYDFTLDGDWENWKDIIQSVDIFMSPALGISNIENFTTFRSSGGMGGGTVDLIDRITQDNIDAITDASSFYFMRSLPLGSVESTPVAGSSNGASPNIPIASDISNLQNLTYREVMSDDPFSNHIIGAKNSYAYNSRLMVVGIKTTLFNGFDERYFQWYGYPYNGVDVPEATAGQYIFEVEIKINGAVSRVYSVFAGTTLPGLFGSALISYPDTRATKISIYHVDQYDATIWNLSFSASLKPHDFLNLAYYLNEKLAPITAQDIGDYIPRDIDNVVSVFEGNKIKTSELNNPLLFPVANTYEVGDGNILALASNAMNVSDRNFGQWPVYVFTDRGIWTMRVGEGEVAFSNVMPTSIITPISSIVCETPHGVVFASPKGLMLINGQTVESLSQWIEQTPPELKIEMNEYCEDIVLPLVDEQLAVSLQNMSALAYNPYEDELIISTIGDRPNYVYNFGNKSFYLTTEKVSTLVKNAMPNLFILDGKTMKNYAHSETPDAHVSLLMRPLYYKTPDKKRMERMILRCLLYNVKNLRTTITDRFSLAMAHYSNDGVNFKAAKGIRIMPGNAKDIDMGMFSQVKANCLMFTFAGIIDEKSKIYYLDAEVEKEYRNDKLR